MPNPCCSPLCPCECVLYQIRRCLSNPNCLTGQRSRSDKNLLRPVVKPLVFFVGGVFVEQFDVLVLDCSGLVNVGDVGPLCQLDSPLDLLVSDSGCGCPTHVSLSFVLCCMSPIILYISAFVNPNLHLKCYFVKVVISRYRIRSYVEPPPADQP